MIYFESSYSDVRGLAAVLGTLQQRYGAAAKANLVTDSLGLDISLNLVWAEGQKLRVRMGVPRDQRLPASTQFGDTGLVMVQRFLREALRATTPTIVFAVNKDALSVVDDTASSSPAVLTWQSVRLRPRRLDAVPGSDQDIHHRFVFDAPCWTQLLRAAGLAPLSLMLCYCGIGSRMGHLLAAFPPDQSWIYLLGWYDDAHYPRLCDMTRGAALDLTPILYPLRPLAGSTVADDATTIRLRCFSPSAPLVVTVRNLYMAWQTTLDPATTSTLPSPLMALLGLHESWRQNDGGGVGLVVNGEQLRTRLRQLEVSLSVADVANPSFSMLFNRSTFDLRLNYTPPHESSATTIRVPVQSVFWRYEASGRDMLGRVDWRTLIQIERLMPWLNHPLVLLWFPDNQETMLICPLADQTTESFPWTSNVWYQPVYRRLPLADTPSRRLDRGILVVRRTHA